MERLIAIGDIHGHAALLERLLREIEPSPTDQFIFLGDYIDRGPEAPQVLDRLITFAEEFPRSVFLRGNHEQMLLDARDEATRQQNKPAVFEGILARLFQDQPLEIRNFLENGGWATVNSYGHQLKLDSPLQILRQIPEEHIGFIQRTRLYYQRDPYFFVHAGIDPHLSLKRESGRQALLWLRSPLWLQDPDWGLTVVHGHTPVPEPAFRELEICLDTGAGHQGCLTACDLLSRRIWQAC
jgi:serine/threonine protein phosphatase 1